MKGTPVSARPPSTNYYWNKLKQVVSSVFPTQSKLGGALRSSAQGAVIALSVVVITSTLIAIVLLISQKSTDLVSILLSGTSVTLGSFGAILLVEPSVAELPVLGSQVNVGIHSVVIAAITLLVVYRVSRRAARASGESDDSGFSPLHLGLGFALMTFGISYVSQGVVTSTVGQVAYQGMTLLSALFVFALVWASSYAGKIRGNAGTSDFEYVWKWITKSIKNFVLIYSGLIALAFLVLVFRNGFEPTYAVAQEPVALSLNLSADETLWLILGLILYGANVLLQFFLLAIGVNVGLDVQGTQGIATLFANIDQAVLGNSSQWMFNLIGPWGYIGVLVLVTLVAFVSGAKAADQIGAKFYGVSTYLKAFFIGLFATLSALFMASIQFSVDYLPAEGEGISAGIVWGASVLGVIAFATVLIFFAHQSAGRSFDYMATAFPRTVLGDRKTGLNGPAYPGARIFGVVTVVAILLVAATPIGVAITNRASALIDGPVQVGENISKTLSTAPINELKKLLNPNSDTSHKWLQDKVLKAAQPSTGYLSKTKVLNDLGKSWKPGNLDATIYITLTKDGKTISKIVKTTSSLETNGLLNHVKYEPSVNPNVIEVALSKFLKGNKKLGITVNGEKVKPGKYFAIPGVYTTKSEGYKLVAPTESTIYVEKESQLISVGYEVNLPIGAAAKLDQAIQEKAVDCFKISPAGESKCVKTSNLSASSDELVPSNYFEYVDSKYSSSGTKCSAERKDALISSSSAKSSSECSTQVSFSRVFFDSKPKQVPKYTFETRCVAEWISSDPSTYGEVLNYRYGWDGFAYYDSRDYSYPSGARYLDDCYSTREVRTQDGYETIQVRGAKISSITMHAEVIKEISVVGKLTSKKTFTVTK